MTAAVPIAQLSKIPYSRGMAKSAGTRPAFIARVRAEAELVLKTGFWPAPKGFLIYWAVNQLNKKVYIGFAKDFLRRVSSHRNSALNGSMLRLHRAMRRDGVHNFVFVPIEYFGTEAEMMEAERVAIALYETQDRMIGYNMADGGIGIGSDLAKAIHQRPAFRKAFLASYPARAIKAAETRRLNKAALHELAVLALEKTK